jgi:glycosyltransferase involved in cell wall biosynthesis
VRYLFLAPIYKKEDENTLLDLSGGIMAPSSNTFPWDIINGIESHNGNIVDIINVLPVGPYPHQYKKLILHTNTWSHNNKSKNVEIGSVNLLFIKQLTRAIKIKKNVKKWIAESGGNYTIIVYCLYQPFLSAIKKLPGNVHVIAVVPDLPQFIDLSTKSSKLISFLRYLNNKKIYRDLNRVDAFAFVTEHMKGLLNIGDKPYTVIEGIAPYIESNNNYNAVNNHKIVFYAGTLNYKYGIQNLLSAFHEIEDPCYCLWICGTGEAANDVMKLCESDKRVTFYGHVNKAKVYELQSKATILVNPRTNEGEFTKYSFPSKTMEYMASGKPVVMYKLDGIPDEYDEYLYYVEDNSVEALKDKIAEVCAKPPEELRKFGIQAREWVLREKNSFRQVEKIIGLIQK